jgi:NAD-dependent SIR2 family protein deacetylase
LCSDFRTEGTGLYDNLQKYNLPYPEAVFDLSFYKNNPDPFVQLASELWPGLKHSPTVTHSFIALLEKKGLLLRNYTQVRYEALSVNVFKILASLCVNRLHLIISIMSEH